MSYLTRKYNVVIMGGGVAGCSTAIALKNRLPHLDILILERSPSPLTKEARRLPVGECLSPHAGPILQKLGIWPAFAKRNFLTAYGTSAIWGFNALHHYEFMYSPFGYGWILDRHDFNSLLVEQALERETEFVWNVKHSRIVSKEDQWHISYTYDEEQVDIQADFIVDASGRKATLCQSIGVEKVNHDRLVAVYQFFGLEESATNLSEGVLIESQEDGWWYSCVLPGRSVILAFMTDADIAIDEKYKRQQQFLKKLVKSKYSKLKIQLAKRRGSPEIIAAHTQELSQKSGHNWISVGDASMTYDPLSSLGIYKSLTSGLYAAFAIEDFVKNKKGGAEKYNKIMNAQFKGYIKKRSEYYKLENRYRDNLFWSRRHMEIKSKLFKNKKHSSHESIIYN